MFFSTSLGAGDDGRYWTITILIISWSGYTCSMHHHYFVHYAYKNSDYIRIVSREMRENLGKCRKTEDNCAQRWETCLTTRRLSNLLGFSCFTFLVLDVRKARCSSVCDAYSVSDAYYRGHWRAVFSHTRAWFHLIFRGHWYTSGSSNISLYCHLKHR